MSLCTEQDSSPEFCKANPSPASVQLLALIAAENLRLDFCFLIFLLLLSELGERRYSNYSACRWHLEKTPNSASLPGSLLFCAALGAVDLGAGFCHSLGQG